METLLLILIKHFWVMFVVMTLIWAWWGWGSVQSRIRKQPELVEGYRRLFKGFAFWANVPWIIMGGLILSGKVNSVFDFLTPISENPYNLYWFASLFALLLLLLYWIFFMQGAETLERYPGLPMVPHWNARKLRYFFIGVTLWNVICGVIIILGLNKIENKLLSFVFPFLFIGIWVGACYLIGAMGGWNTLAEHYRNKSDFQGELFRFNSGKLGMAGYGGCLTLGASPHGFYLETLFLFRFGHPALLIPWEDISVNVKNRWLFSSTDFEFSKCPEIVLNLSKRLAKKIAGASGGRLTISDHS